MSYAAISPSASKSIIRPCKSRSIRTSPARLRPMRWFSVQRRQTSFWWRKFAHRHADPRRSFREAPIEGAERRSVIGADRQMEGVACAKIEFGLVGKARCRAKVFPRHGERPKAFGAQPGERRKRVRAMVRVERARPQFHR